MLILLLSLLSAIIILIPHIMNMKMSYNLNKSNTFECGFDSFNFARSPFSIHFFKLCMIFIIFDIEIIIILPTPFITFSIHIYLLITCMMIIIFMLSLIIEWQQNSLNWMI